MSYATTEFYNNNILLSGLTISHGNPTAIPELRLASNGSVLKYDGTEIDAVVFTPETGLKAASHSINVKNANGALSHDFTHAIPDYGSSADVTIHDFQSTGSANWELKVTTNASVDDPALVAPT